MGLGQVPVGAPLNQSPQNSKGESAVTRDAAVGRPEHSARRSPPGSQTHKTEAKKEGGAGLGDDVVGHRVVVEATVGRVVPAAVRELDAQKPACMSYPHPCAQATGFLSSSGAVRSQWRAAAASDFSMIDLASSPLPASIALITRS